MKQLPVAADAVFYAACTFLPILCILRYFGAPVWLSILAAGALAVCVGLAVFLLETRTRGKRLLSARQARERDALLLHLALAPARETEELLRRARKKEQRSAQTSGQPPANDSAVEFLFTLEPLSADRLASLIRARGKQFTLFCSELSPAAEKLTKTFPITVIRGDEVYRLLTEPTGTPPRPLYKEQRQALLRERRPPAPHEPLYHLSRLLSGGRQPAPAAFRRTAHPRTVGIMVFMPDIVLCKSSLYYLYLRNSLRFKCLYWKMIGSPSRSRR